MPSGRSLLIVALAAATVSAQTPPQPPFKSDTSAVMVDVVVRDKKGNPVTDLAAADFEVLEDGVPQSIASMTLVAPGREAARDLKRPAVHIRERVVSSPSTSVQPSLVAFVFDRLSPEARLAATKAAQETVGAFGVSDFAGVFMTDLSLVTVQTFTNDRTRLAKAIHEVSTRATSTFNRAADRVRSEGHFDAAVSYTAGAESPGRGVPRTGGGGTIASAQSDAAFARMVERMETTYELLSRDHQGFTTTNSLLALVATLGSLPGRKSIVYFAESLAVPVAVRSRFDSVIQNANRSNVTIYAVDAAGLRVQSDQSQVARELGCLSTMTAGCENVWEAVGNGYTRADLLVDLLMKDPATALGTLSEATGGFLINNTNDLARGVRDIDKDRRFHYLLTYTPKNQNFDGKWRSLEVRVPSRQTQVRARSGYLAVRGMSGIPLLAYEAPALAALDLRPPPRRLPLKATALGLLSRGGEPRVAVVVSTDASAVTFKPNAVKDAFASDFTILARIKDGEGAVERKASEPYRLSRPVADLDRARQGEILFFRQPELPPGSYMLEAAVHDAIANTAGTRFVPFTVHEPGPKGLLVGSLVLVARTERATDAKPGDTNPLLAGDLLLYPRLGEPYRRSADKVVPFFFRLKVPTGTPVPNASLVLVKNGQPAASVPLQLAAPNAQGVIDHVAQLPLEAISAGDYVLRLVVQAEGEPITREAPLRVVE